MKPFGKIHIAVFFLNALVMIWFFYQRSQRPDRDPGGSAISSSGLNREQLVERIRSSTVVVITKHTVDGQVITSSFEEFLKKNDKTAFHHKLGDAFEHITPEVRKNYSIPDGAITFYEGSPARFSSSLSFYKNQIPGALNLTVDQFKKLVKQANATPPR